MSTNMSTNHDDLLVEHRGAVLVLTFNRPDVRNAMSLAGSKRMVAALEELDSDDKLGAAVLTGAGGNFCSGMDLKASSAESVPMSPRKPLITAVEGYALAGGFEAALACDLIVASTSACFALPEVKRGIVAAAGGLMRLPRRIPYHIAMQCALTGDTISAERAAQFGLVNELVEPGQALDTAMELAHRILGNSPLAVAVSKRVVSESGDWSSAEMFHRQAPIVGPVFGSEDAGEGPEAFAERRAPRWTSLTADRSQSQWSASVPPLPPP
jgi:enoyl-CoA hydratase